ncbi:endonuclease VII domain-containing protein [Streptomyces sp. NBC_01244]|uniref:endonuclease VII domain-containing protein n=1 Tax=Streptomyces sp. NBC_01244 TaxID=2903797 RepID=UPI002E0D1DCA|nr:endonuclease VII domain-containing protein [Streptomyces sp. NBC_01244]
MPVRAGSKRCVRCGEERPRAAFGIKRSNMDGLQKHCRDCAPRGHLKALSAEAGMVRRRVEVPEGHKLCTRCGEVKPHSGFHRNSSAPDGRNARCKTCRAVEGRAGHLRRKYGITEGERDQMIADQGGLCCICLRAPAVHVDHCHKTGRVRGVLCFNCNTGVGLLQDDPDHARRAVEYLEGNLWNPTFEAQGVCRQPS